MKRGHAKKDCPNAPSKKPYSKEVMEESTSQELGGTKYMRRVLRRQESLNEQIQALRSQIVVDLNYYALLTRERDLFKYDNFDVDVVFTEDMGYPIGYLVKPPMPEVPQ